MAGPRNKRKRAETPPVTAPDEGRDAIGTEPSGVSRTDSEDGFVDDGRNRNITSSEPISADTVQVVRAIDGNDHAECETPRLSLLDQNKVGAVMEAAEVSFSERIVAAHATGEVAKPRKSAIADFLEHRMMLLLRVKQARSAAETRIKIMTHDEPSRQHETDEHETARFYERAREANAVARKQSRHESAAPLEVKRSALRRGNGVGKKMNAAISTLTHGSVVSDAPQPGSMSHLESSVHSAPVSKSIETNAMTSTMAIVQTKIAGHALPKKEKAASSVTSQSDSIEVTAKSTSHLSPPAPSTAKLTVPVLQSRVHCPEASALRDRKRQLEMRLSALYSDKLQRRPVNVHNDQRTPDHISLPLTVSPTRKRGVLSQDMSTIIQGPGGPSFIPNRRLTHWDVLLDEMKWLATDFVEERKWKWAATKYTSKLLRCQRDIAAKMTAGEQIPGSEDSKIQPGRAPLNDELICDIAGIDRDTAYTKYKLDSNEDTTYVQTVAKRLSQLLLDASFHTSSMAAKLQGNKCGFPVRGDNNLLSNAGNSGETSEGMMPNERSISPMEKNFVFESMSKHADCILGKVIPDRELKRNRSRKQGLPLELSPCQIAAVEAVEYHWQSLRSGIQLGGLDSSGKTIVCCTLLHKERLQGPQLVFCRRQSVLKWTHEIKRMGDVRVIVMDRYSCAKSQEFVAKDVVVCEFATLFEFSLDELSNFHSVFVDLRFPQGFISSRSKMKDDAGGVSLESRDSTSIHVPGELVSTTWWAQLAAIAQVISKRLIIDDLVPRSSYNHLYPELRDRRKIEIIALRVMFLFGFTSLPMLGYTLGKSVLAWARWCIKSKDVQLTKLDRVRNLLRDMLNKLSYRMQQSLAADKSLCWDVRNCELTEIQRKSYLRGCLRFSPVLSTCPNHIRENLSANAFEPFCTALLELRRLCLHANSSMMVSEALREAHGSLHRLTIGSPSQTNFELAGQILRGSTKLDALLRILVTECGIVSPCIDSFARFLDVEGSTLFKCGPLKEVKSKRVAVLATLPEAQVLASSLLSSIGIPHHMLLSVKLENGGKASSSSATDRLDDNQELLSRFNSDLDSEAPMIIISSPEYLCGDHGGLSVERAEMVVLLDEDWSGRGQLLLRSLTSRCSARDWKLHEGSCRFIRLVTSQTCESTLLDCKHQEIAATSKQSDAVDAVRMGWPTSATGVFSLPSNIHNNLYFMALERAGKCDRSEFIYPVGNICLLRNRPLSDVLGTPSDTPQLLMSPQLLFLPLSDQVQQESVQNFHMAACLLQQEEHAGSSIRFSVSKRRYVRSMQLSTAEIISKIRCLPRVGAAAHRGSLCVVLKSCQSWSDDSTNEELDHFAAVLALPRESSGLSIQAQTFSTESDGPKSRELDEVSGISCESLLLYQSKVDNNMASQSDDKRLNAYSNVFCQSHTSAFVGCRSYSEVLLYGPPLFPGILECVAQARWNAQGGQPRKRAKMENNLPSEKRARLEVGSLEPALADDSSKRCDSASVLDLSDDYGLAGLGVTPLPDYSVLISGSAMTGAFRNFLPFSNFPWLNRLPPCDADEERASLAACTRNSRMDKMLLFVARKRRRDGQGPLIASSGWTGMTRPLQSINSSFQDVNGKRLKKKIPTSKQIGVSAFSQLTSLPLPSAEPLGPSHTESSVSRSIDPQARMALVSKKLARSKSLFESPFYQMSVFRVRNRIADRLDRLVWNSPTAFDVGPGLPLFVKHHLSGHHMNPIQLGSIPTSSIVNLRGTQGSITSNEAKAASPRTALRRDPNGPCRVDFGPFQCGFLAAPSGMGASAPTRFRRGVSLPMGVKVHVPKEIAFAAWTREEDTLLHKSVSRFGMNWVLISKIVSGFNQTHLLHKQDKLRAPRECRERWQVLVTLLPTTSEDRKDQINEERAAEQIRKLKPDSERCSHLGIVSYVSEFLLSELDEIEKVFLMERAKDGKPSGAIEKQLALFKAAKAKQRKVPTAIPGISGSTPTTLPVHPSHAQAIQTVVASTASFSIGGRTEMWPLQLLEIFDRQRAASAITSSALPSGPSANMNPAKPQATSSRTQVKQPSTHSSHPMPMAASASASQQRSMPSSKLATGTSASQQPTSSMVASFNPPPSVRAMPPASHRPVETADLPLMTAPSTAREPKVPSTASPTKKELDHDKPK